MILHIQECRLEAVSDCRVTAVLPIRVHVVVDDTGGQKQPLRVEGFFSRQHHLDQPVLKRVRRMVLGDGPGKPSIEMVVGLFCPSISPA